MTTVTLPGLIKNNTEVKPNVETPDAVTHLKELMDSKLDGKTLSEWAVGKSADKPKDSSAPTDKKDAAPGDIKDAAQVGGAKAEGTDGKVEGNDSKGPAYAEIKCEYEGKVKEALCKMHIEVSKNVKSREWLKNNIKETTI